MVWDIAFQQSVGIARYANLTCATLGHDSPEHCFDRKHYNTYPVPVEYRFNEIGYRTNSIESFTGNEILAIGDSFTLGLGVAQQHSWPEQLSALLNYPVLNFSLNGASNAWMQRKTMQLLNRFTPQAIVVHYTFSHRRERTNTSWTDDERTECEPFYTDLENYQDWKQTFDYFECLNIPVVHGFVPNWHTQDVNYSQLPGKVIPPPVPIDLARDGFHYGVATNRQLAQQITNLLVDV
jgi:hypothetical protein